MTKLRDGPAGAAFTFKLQPVVLGLDEDGAEVTACLVTDLQEATETPRAPRDRLTAVQRIALDALNWLLDSRDKRRPAPQEAINGGARIGQYVVTFEDWRQACYFRAISDGEQDAKRKAFKRAASDLQASHRVQIGGEFVWLANE